MLVATLMGDARPDAVNASVGRLQTALDFPAEGDGEGADRVEIAPSVANEVRSAIELLQGGQSCAAVSALLAARAALGPS
ncbi:MAG TPA: hypothetical protein VHH34_02945 [Pseudonocardiaceae bacterium]|nr:hypothetical protein [Pseudonocardiaceae bacterium]